MIPPTSSRRVPLPSDAAASSLRTKHPARSKRARALTTVAVVGLALVPMLSLAAGCLVVHDHGEAYYDACGWDAECPDGSVCHRVEAEHAGALVVDHICTFHCVDDSDCPGRSACVAAGFEPPLCYARCANDWQCPSGFVCSFAIEAADGICLP